MCVCVCVCCVCVCVCLCVWVVGGWVGRKDGERGESERRTGPQIISDSLLKANVLSPAWLTENTEKVEIPTVEFMAVGTARKALF